MIILQICEGVFHSLLSMPLLCPNLTVKNVVPNMTECKYFEIHAHFSSSNHIFSVGHGFF